MDLSFKRTKVSEFEISSSFFASVLEEKCEEWEEKKENYVNYKDKTIVSSLTGKFSFFTNFNLISLIISQKILRVLFQHVLFNDETLTVIYKSFLNSGKLNKLC